MSSQGNLELTQKIVPNDPVHAEKRFGESVDISNKFAIVGAPHDNPRSLSDSGSIYFLKYKILSEMTPTPTPTPSPTPTYTPSFTITPTPTEDIYCNSEPCNIKLAPNVNYENFANVSYSIFGSIYDANKTRTLALGDEQVDTKVSSVTLSTKTENDNISNWLFCFFDNRIIFKDDKPAICLALDCETKFNGDLNIGFAMLKNETYYYFGISGEKSDKLKLESQQVNPEMFLKIYGDEI